VTVLSTAVPPVEVTSRRDPVIDVIRAIAIVGVVGGHWWVTALVLTADGNLAVTSPLVHMPSACSSSPPGSPPPGPAAGQARLVATRPATPGPAVGLPAALPPVAGAGCGFPACLRR
jgi:hypothetical protein